MATASTGEQTIKLSIFLRHILRHAIDPVLSSAIVAVIGLKSRGFHMSEHIISVVSQRYL